MKRYTRYFGIVCVALLPLIGAEYHGQVAFNQLPMPGVTVVATQGEKKLSAVTDPQGIYQFQDLPDGVWQLEIDKLGFTPVKQEITQGSGLPGPSLEMKMLSLDKIDTVSAPPAPAVVVGPASTTATSPTPNAPPATPSIVAANSRPAGGRGAAVPPAASAFQRTDLKGNANAPAAPAEAAPEVTSELNQRAADGFLINGSAQNGASSPFAQSPAFGNNRRGGPRLYSYGITLRESNSSLNANSYSLTGQQTEKLPTNQLNVGFNFGGPMKIPHLVSTRNNVGLNIGYSRTTNSIANIRQGTMPTDLQRAGDFSGLTTPAGDPIQVFDPFTNQPFVGNVMPASRISPQALALLQLYPRPNFTGNLGQNYQVATIDNTHTDSGQIRINKSFKRKNTISGSFAMSDTRSDNASVFNFLDLGRTLGMQATASYRRSFTPRFYGTFTYQFSRQSSQTYPFFSNVSNISGAAGITGNDQTPLNWGPPSLGFSQSGITGLSDANASINHNQTSLYSYLGVWSHGRHSIQFGGDFRWQQYNTYSQNAPRGNFTFNGTAAGYDFAGFLAGVPDQSDIAFGNADKYFRSKNPDLFFQDDWKVTPGFSVTLGIRWDYMSPITELYGRMVNLDVAPGFAAVKPVLATSPTGSLTNASYPSSLIRPQGLLFSPKPAFAWRPFPASSMVVRGGYGISYNTNPYNYFANQMAQQSPLSKRLQVANSADNPLTLANGFYAPANVNTNSIAVDPNFKIGYAQVWNLSVQRDLPASLVMLATYTGTKGTHQLQAFVPHTYPKNAPNPLCLTCPNNYTYFTSGGNSTRQSGAIQLRRRLHNGFTATGTYTYSKSIDDAANLGGSNGQPAQDWLNLAGERGPSSIDQRHRAEIQFQYTSGMGVGGGALLTGWRGKLLKDWTFVDNIVVGTGFPLTPTFPYNGDGGVNPSARPSFTGLSLYDAPDGKFLNPLAISTPATGQWGNAGRNSIRGPNQFTMNASMQRSFKLSDRFNLSLQIDAQNPLNHVVVNSWGTLITDQKFGQAIGVGAMRSVTTNMRLTF